MGRKANPRQLIVRDSATPGEKVAADLARFRQEWIKRAWGVVSQHQTPGPVGQIVGQGRE